MNENLIPLTRDEREKLERQDEHYLRQQREEELEREKRYDPSRYGLMRPER